MKTKIASSVLCGLVLMSPLAAQAHQAGDWLVRGGIINVSPDDSSGNVYVDGLGSTDMGIGVDDDTQIGLNFAYMFTDNIAVELLAATPFTHDVDLEKSQLGLGDGKLAEVSHLPPTLSVQYFFGTSESVFRPYVGVGLNYTVFFDEEFSGSRKEQGFSDLDLDSSFGWSAQLGADYSINKDWFVNAQVRYIDISTDADFKVGGAKSSVSVDIDPWVYMASVGYRF
ncbi:outer membrane protein OmpW [Corallincola holothuriorum]|uniref:Outer membrane protein OmpW n=1 Tax=Corallincola holothuriorum TaxID=2282215 RepID=A0A368NPK0_9GAMM|nr:OmpW family outer membrane protein [Corallincola holothuriorum]RCU51785.1 outer membrane protein OmpW [Corallincola holothuriorum]